MKKFKIISLVSIILIAMIGIPSVKHFCDMMDISFSGECESSCDYNSDSEMTTYSCCSAETGNTFRITLGAQDGNCCSEEFIFNKIDDEFLINKTELTNRISISEIIINLSLDKTLNEYTSTKFLFKDLSPPTINKPDIYLSNHSFLI